MGPGGIRLFLDQFTKILRNSSAITETLKAVQRQEVVTSQMLLGDGIYTYVSPDDPHLDIRYYRDPFSRELPTDISISMGMQEWECF